MTMESAASSGSSRYKPSSRHHGVPKKCSCGCSTVTKTSRSEQNPGRRYFRCGFAASNKLMNDSHCFKWIDEALLEEIETMKEEIQSLQEENQKLKSTHQENMQMLVKDMCETVEGAMFEVNSKLKNMVIVITVLCVLISCVIKML